MVMNTGAMDSMFLALIGYTFWVNHIQSMSSLGDLSSGQICDGLKMVASEKKILGISVLFGFGKNKEFR